MGKLVEGEWTTAWYGTQEHGGRFVRPDALFRDAIAWGGAHPPAAGRYHLYVAMACPWAHRTLLYRSLKGLQGVVSVSVVEPLMLERGWTFGPEHPDHLFGSAALYEVYLRARPGCTTRVTVPVLWDKATNTVVNNESSEIIRFFDGPLATLGDPSAPLAGVPMRPPELVEAIDRWNERIYDAVNNGVYKAGFATSQAAYDEAVVALFACLDELEAVLTRQRYLVGDRLTEADWRLFPTILRFDPVYHHHFKCSLRRIRDYPNLWAWARELFQMPGVAATWDEHATRQHYFQSHESINPHRILPVAPVFDPWEPHGRERLPAAALRAEG